MSDVLPPKVALKASFPAVEIEACLRNELIHVVEERAGLEGVSLPSTPAAIVTATFAIDSLDVVEILCKVDELAGFNLPDGVVCSGGYNSIDKAIKHMMPRIEKVWTKQKGGTV
jgi:acyl carrier protein